MQIGELDIRGYCGYKPYIIKDMGKYNLEFVEEKFNEFIRRDSPVG